MNLLKSEMFYQYLKIRAKQTGRLMQGIGTIRSLLVTGLAVILFCVLVKLENPWIMPVVAVFLLWLYHNERKDKAFLTSQIRYARSLLRAEYLLLALPFLIAAISKMNLFSAGGIGMAALLLPEVKTIRIKSLVIPLPLFASGGVEYLRMFRKYWALYLMLLFVALAGSLHGNVRIAKVCLMLWGAMQGLAFIVFPNIHELTYYLNFRLFQKRLLAVILWNVGVSGLLFLIIILGGDLTGQNGLFLLGTFMATAIYLWNLGTVRYLCRTSAELCVYWVVLVLPLFVCSCFSPFMLLPFIGVTVWLTVRMKHKFKKIWN